MEHGVRAAEVTGPAATGLAATGPAATGPAATGPTATGPFSRRAALLTGGTGLLSLLAAFALLLLPGDELRVQSYEADSFSRSAIGHRGIVQLLRELGRDVLQRRSPGKVDADSLLVLAEPNASVTADELRRRVDGGHATLVVLPKREVHEDERQPGWVDRAWIGADHRATTVLRHLAEAAAWTSRTDAIDALPAAFASAFDLPSPVLPDRVQLLSDPSRDVQAIVACSRGVLLGRIGNVYVLSDPDVIANHGLADNAAFAVAMFALLCAHGPIVFDETIHGHAREPSLWRALGSWPLVLVPVHLLLLFAVVLWTAHGRFGPVRQDPRAIAAGKGFLIDNIAALLRTGRALRPALARWAALRMRTAARRLHAPAGKNQRDVDAWLLARADRQGRGDDLRRALDVATTGATDRDRLAAARELHRLTEEIL
jgi:hypothetical protein